MLNCVLERDNQCANSSICSGCRKVKNDQLADINHLRKVPTQRRLHLLHLITTPSDNIHNCNGQKYTKKSISAVAICIASKQASQDSPSETQSLGPSGLMSAAFRCDFRFYET